MEQSAFNNFLKLYFFFRWTAYKIETVLHLPSVSVVLFVKIISRFEDFSRPSREHGVQLCNSMVITHIQ